MKAFRNIGGNIVEIEVDVGPDNVPLLPPDTTVDPRPDPLPGHYVTVVGNSWVQIPIPQEFTTFEYKKQKALEALKKYKEWYLEQPVEHNGVLFDADETARIRLTQALVVHSASSYLPPYWITANNDLYPIENLSDLMGIVNAVQTAFTTRFFEMDGIRRQILNASNEEELNAINIPTIPDRI